MAHRVAVALCLLALACSCVLTAATSAQVQSDVEPAIALIETADTASIGTAAIDVNAPLDPSLLEEAHSHRAATVLLELTTTAQSLLETDVNDQAASSMSGTNSASSSSTTEVEALLRMADVADDLRSKYSRVISNMQSQYSRKKHALKAKLERILKTSYTRLESFKRLVAMHKDANTKNVATTRSQRKQLKQLQTQLKKAKARLRKAVQKTRAHVNKVRKVRQKWQRQLAKLRKQVERRVATTAALKGTPPVAGSTAVATAPGTKTRLHQLRVQAMRQRRLRRVQQLRQRRAAQRVRRTQRIKARGPKRL